MARPETRETLWRVGACTPDKHRRLFRYFFASVVFSTVRVCETTPPSRSRARRSQKNGALFAGCSALISVAALGQNSPARVRAMPRSVLSPPPPAACAHEPAAGITLFPHHHAAPLRGTSLCVVICSAMHATRGTSERREPLHTHPPVLILDMQVEATSVLTPSTNTCLRSDSPTRSRSTAARYPGRPRRGAARLALPPVGP